MQLILKILCLVLLAHCRHFSDSFRISKLHVGATWIHGDYGYYRSIIMKTCLRNKAQNNDFMTVNNASIAERIRDILGKSNIADKSILGFTAVLGDRALKAAVQCNAAISNNNAESTSHSEYNPRASFPTRSQLWGAAVAIKDNICMRNTRITCGSRILQRYQPSYDATVVQRLDSAGAIIVGQTNMDQFAMGSGTRSSIYPATRNPWSICRVAGGSSGGSAAVVASCQVNVSLGSDTGGSVRLPASFCGVIGIKPTYGLVSRFGLVAYSSSMDCIGPISRTVLEGSATLDAISGFDERDITTHANKKKSDLYSTCLQIQSQVGSTLAPLRGVRIGIMEQSYHTVVDNDVASAVQNAVTCFQELGASVYPINVFQNWNNFKSDDKLNELLMCTAAYYTIASVEACSNLARFDGIRYSGCEVATELLSSEGDRLSAFRSSMFGPEVMNRLSFGSMLLQSSSDEHDLLSKADQIRKNLIISFSEIFRPIDNLQASFNDADPVHYNSVDIILSPTVIRVAPRLDEQTTNNIFTGLKNVMQRHKSSDTCYATDCLDDIFTVLASMTGYPAISLPFGFKRNSIDSAGKIDSKYCSPKDDQDSPTKNRDSLDASVEYLPIGIQLIGRKFDEATLLSAAAAIEKYVIM